MLFLHLKFLITKLSSVTNVITSIFIKITKIFPQKKIVNQISENVLFFGLQNFRYPFLQRTNKVRPRPPSFNLITPLFTLYSRWSWVVSIVNGLILLSFGLVWILSTFCWFMFRSLFKKIKLTLKVWTYTLSPHGHCNHKDSVSLLEGWNFCLREKPDLL